MRTSRSNIRFLRSEFMGSMRAWLPSRRSTAHQRGALSIRLVGHVRSGKSTAICSWNDTYLPNGIPDGVWGWSTSLTSSSVDSRSQPDTANSATREAEGLGPVAAAKEEE